MNFHRTLAPTLEETGSITEKIARRVHRWLEKRMQESDSSKRKAPLKIHSFLQPYPASVLCRARKKSYDPAYVRRQLLRAMPTKHVQAERLAGYQWQRRNLLRIASAAGAVLFKE